MVVDMPKGTYRNPSQAKKNAKMILNKTNCDAVKIESNNKNFKIIKEKNDRDFNSIFSTRNNRIYSS